MPKAYAYFIYKQVGKENMQNFCAAPWVEGLLLSNGEFQTCCRNPTSFGNWQVGGLENCWHSESFQKFRKQIADGNFPDVYCKLCYGNGTARSLGQEIYEPFRMNKKIVTDYVHDPMPELAKLETLFKLREKNKDTAEIFEEYFAALNRLIKGSARNTGLETRSIKERLICLLKRDSKQPLKSEASWAEYKNALTKLETIGLAVKAYLEKNLTPPIIAPFRQVGLIYKCNARCIHCPGRYSGEIFDGLELDEKYLDIAFGCPEWIIDFFMNGSEFLFYRDWKKIAARLIDHGTKLSISTNGILLTSSNIKYLIDNRIIKNLNISIDGARKETVESIRKNVDFDKLCDNINFLFDYTSEKKYIFTLGFSFVLIKRNYRELPQFIRLIDKLRRDRKLPVVAICIQALENCTIEKYRDFAYSEHHSLIDRKELVETFKETLKESHDNGITTHVFYSWEIADFVQQGCPFPSLSL